MCPAGPGDNGAGGRTWANGAGDAQKQIMTTLDYANAPVQVANFIRIIEGNTPPAGGATRPAAWRGSAP